jgi:hypothetical protein
MAKGKRASLDQCRIEACQKIDEIVKEREVNKREAMRQLAGETGVPYGTLNYWYYRDDASKKDLKVPVPQTVENSQKVRVKVARKIIDNMAKALDKERSEAQRETLKATAQEQAQELGDAVLAEELYEMFLKKIAELNKIILANTELDDPMDASKVIDQLLRMARNSGWEEYNPPEGLCEKCKIKDRQITCPNRTCENNVQKKKKQVKGKAKAKGEK